MCPTGPGSGARDPPTSSNSPFWQGKESGRSSYRHQIWGRWPSAGPTEIFGSAEHYPLVHPFTFVVDHALVAQNAGGDHGVDFGVRWRTTVTTP
ncbi:MULTISPECIES: glutamate-cysteine ligase family protein [unclassified Streptomyces]|uniref:glutamate-cysteine ligase family protein n=1 Tax=unclassified Streptomyces TaxID=2593676 RepID=UPI002B1CD65E|nr:MULTISPECIES: glutamate-cysteine ligase family protein [unclassified Streptomyces]